MYTNEVEFSISKMKVFVQYQNISIFQTTTPSKWNCLSKEDDDYVDNVMYVYKYLPTNPTKLMC